MVDLVRYDSNSNMLYLSKDTTVPTIIKLGIHKLITVSLAGIHV